MPFPKAKKSGSGLTLRSDGTATLVWPSGKVAVIVDFVAPRSSSKGASGGFSISASHHKSGKLALNFDAAGTGYSFVDIVLVQRCANVSKATSTTQRRLPVFHCGGFWNAGFVNYPPPSSSILLSTNQSGVGTIMDKKYNIVRKWDAVRTHRVNSLGSLVRCSLRY